MNSDFSVALVIFLWVALGFCLRKIFRIDAKFLNVLASKGDLLFEETFVSGFASQPPFFGRAGAAWACVLLIDKDSLWLWPMAFFRPFFIARLIGMERRIPLSNIQVIGVADAHFGKRKISLIAKDKNLMLTLYVRRAEEFLKVLNESHG